MPPLPLLASALFHEIDALTSPCLQTFEAAFRLPSDDIIQDEVIHKVHVHAGLLHAALPDDAGRNAHRNAVARQVCDHNAACAHLAAWAYLNGAQHAHACPQQHSMPWPQQSDTHCQPQQPEAMH